MQGSGWYVQGVNRVQVRFRVEGLELGVGGLRFAYVELWRTQ